MNNLLLIYAITVTFLLIIMAAYIIYRHKTNVKGSILYTGEIVEKIIDDLKTYQVEVNQFKRVLLNVRTVTADIAKQLNIKEQLPDVTFIKFEESLRDD